MSARQTIEAVLVGLAVLVTFISGIGLWRSRNVYARLHFLGPVSVLAPAFLAIAVVLERGFSQQGNKAIVVAVLLLIWGPVLTHATGKAARRRGEPDG
jgi:multicomponent Na+:H+ antiporter subunit G